MFHESILETYYNKKEFRMKDEFTINEYTLIHIEELKLYQASSNRAMIPMGFCKRMK